MLFVHFGELSENKFRTLNPSRNVAGGNRHIEVSCIQPTTLCSDIVPFVWDREGNSKHFGGMSQTFFLEEFIVTQFRISWLHALNNSAVVNTFNSISDSLK